MSEVTSAVQIVMPQHCNGYGRPRVFGGQLMAWIDVIAAVAARRYAGTNVTTACVDHLSFMSPAFENDVIYQEAWVTWTGRTSMEVRVDSYVEQQDGTRKPVNRAYLVFVAIDANDKPVPVKPFVPETNEEKLEYRAAEERRMARMGR